MMFPERFPFDVLDPAPDYCQGCGCLLAEPEADEACSQPECECHQELGPNGLRYRWGDR